MDVSKKMTTDEKEVTKNLSIDEMLNLVGEYGRYQKIINILFCITMFPSCFHVLIMYFCVKNPPWRCALNSTTCTQYNRTFDAKDNSRCHLARHDWEFTEPRDYSIVTDFDLVCEREYLSVFPTSALFFGFIFGASTLGWFADNFGRKKVHYLSISVVIILGFLSTFFGNIYAFIVCRFVIGFFMHGTFPQLYVMISEIVGDKDRAWANNVTFISVAIGFSFLALKAYLVSSYKLLFRLCTLPYIFVVFFYFFVPESVRYLRVKGRMDEAMTIFRKIGRWNKRELPSNVALILAPENKKNQKTSPFDLFRTKKMAIISGCLGWSAFCAATSFYCLYLASAEITGHMYIDFVVITVLDIPMALISTPLLNKYGRKKNSMIFMLIGSISCMALGFTPRRGHYKALRLIFGMVGKTCIVVGGMARGIWALELFPTHIRGEGIGMVQVLNKIGATSSAWIDKELSKVYDGAVFIMIGVLTFTAFCVMTLLTETNGVATVDTEEEESVSEGSSVNEETGNKSNSHKIKDGDNDVAMVVVTNNKRDEEARLSSYTNIAIHLDDVDVSNEKDSV